MVLGNIVTEKAKGRYSVDAVKLYTEHDSADREDRVAETADYGETTG